MRNLKVTGNSDCQQITLHGDATKQPEPEEVRICFPGGVIYVARCDREGNQRPEWWAHILVFNPDHPDTHRIENLDEYGDPGPTARIVDARVDCYDQGATETIHLAEILQQPGLDHIAIKIEEMAPKKA